MALDFKKGDKVQAVDRHGRWEMADIIKRNGEQRYTIKFKTGICKDETSIINLKSDDANKQCRKVVEPSEYELGDDTGKQRKRRRCGKYCQKRSQYMEQLKTLQKNSKVRFYDEDDDNVKDGLVELVDRFKRIVTVRVEGSEESTGREVHASRLLPEVKEEKKPKMPRKQKKSASKSAPKVRSSKVNHHFYEYEPLFCCALHADQFSDYPQSPKRRKSNSDRYERSHPEWMDHLFDSDSSDSSTDENQNNVKSVSEVWRQSGNDLYKRAFAFKENVLFQRDMLLEALKHYRKALSLSYNDEDTVSAMKNVATAALGIARTVSVDMVYKLKYIKIAVEFFDKSLVRGSDVKPSSWSSSLMATYNQCLQELIGYLIEAVPKKEAIIALEDLTTVMSDKYYKGECFLQIAKSLFRQVLVDLAEGDFRCALTGIRDMYQPMERTRSLLARESTQNKKYLRSEMNVLDEDVYLHTCIAESMQARMFGDKQLALVRDMEYLNMDMVYDVIDWYKKAIILTREKEVEMEAIALSRLGGVYEEVLKMKHRAKENYMRCMQLAHSLHPRTFDNDDWFIKARDSLKKFQDEVVKQEQDEWQEERKEFLDQLKEELEILKKKQYEYINKFLKFIVKKFPPKGKFTLPTEKQLDGYDEECYDQRKKIFMKVLFAYHPDKQNKKEHGGKWAVLCEEISKVLNQKYSENFKGGL